MRRAEVRWRPAKINGQQYFCVTCPKPGGGRKQEHFKSRSEALALYNRKKIERARCGTETELLSGRETRLLRDWEEILKPYGKTIADAITHYIAHLKASEVSELLKAKESDGVSKTHLRDIRYRLNAFAERFNGQTVATITSKEIFRQGSESKVTRVNASTVNPRLRLRREGRTIWIVDAHGYGQHFIVRVDEILTAFTELQRAIHKLAVSLIA